MTTNRYETIDQAIAELQTIINTLMTAPEQSNVRYGYPKARVRLLAAQQHIEAAKSAGTSLPGTATPAAFEQLTRLLEKCLYNWRCGSTAQALLTLLEGAILFAQAVRWALWYEVTHTSEDLE